jgi:chemotaxis protein methyltransferase CheR
LHEEQRMTGKTQPQDMQFLRDLVKKNSGIYLTEDKDYLLETRLLPLLRKLNLATLSDLVTRLKSHAEANVVADIVEAMTTNETSFFRDLRPFNVMRDGMFPDIMAKKGPGETIRILSAACSSGQEAYSIAMMILENQTKWGTTKFSIQGVDIDNTILTKARDGLYTQFEVQRGLPIAMMLKYFTQEDERWRVKPEVKQMVTFSQGNLMEKSMSGGPFDIVLCRNVLIYFEEALKKQVIASLLMNLRPEGFFIIGASESGFGLNSDIQAFGDVSGIFRYQPKK